MHAPAACSWRPAARPVRAEPRPHHLFKRHDFLLSPYPAPSPAPCAGSPPPNRPGPGSAAWPSGADRRPAPGRQPGQQPGPQHVEHGQQPVLAQARALGQGGRNDVGHPGDHPDRQQGRTNELTTVQAVRATNSRELRGGINMPISAAMAAGMPNASAIFNAANPPNPSIPVPYPCYSSDHPASLSPAHGRAQEAPAMEEKTRSGRNSRPLASSRAYTHPTLISEPAMKPWTRRQPAANPRPPWPMRSIVIWPRSQPRRRGTYQSSQPASGGRPNGDPAGGPDPQLGLDRAATNG